MNIFDGILDYFKSLRFFDYLITILIIIILSLIIVGILYLNRYREKHLFILSKFRNKVERVQINIKANSAVIYTFDNIASVSKSSYIKWSRSFSQRNSLALFSWINKIMKGTSDKDILSFIDTDKVDHYYLSHSFKIIKYDKENRTISLTHVVIPYSSNKNITSSSTQTIDRLKFNLESLKNKSDVLIGYISFFPTNSLIDYYSYQLDEITFSKIFQYVSKYCDEKHFAIKLEENNSIVFVIYNYNKWKDKFVSSVEKSLKKFFTLSSIKDESFSICYSNSLSDNNDFNDILDNLKALAYYNFQKQNFVDHVFEFDKNKNLNFNFKEEMTKKIEEAIKEKKLDFFYNPFYDIRTNNVNGYTIRIVANKNLYSTYDYFLNQCFECDRLYELCLYVTDTIAHAFPDHGLDEKYDAFIEFPPQLMKYLTQSTYLNLFKKIKNINFNICLKSHQINEYIRFDPDFATYLKDIIFNSEAQIKFSLDISSLDNINDDIALSFSSVSIDDVYYHNLQIETEKRIIINDMLYRYNHTKNIPIYCYNIKDSKSLEEIIANHICLISGKVLHHDNSFVNSEFPLEITDTIKDLYDKYY